MLLSQERVTLKLKAGETVTLAAELATDTTVRHLTLTGNCGDAGAAALGAALKTNHTLRSLVLSSNKIKLKGVTGLAEGLAENRGLMLLDLGNNAIGDAGGMKVAAALAVNKSLISLCVALCELEEESAVALGAALKRNTTLEQLNLGSGFKMRTKGFLALADAIKTNTTLKYLHFQDVELDSTVPEGHAGYYAVTADALKAFAAALAVNTGLVKLNFFGTGTIGDEGFEALAGALESNNTLRSLHVGSGLTSRGCAAFGAALVKNTSLYSLQHSTGVGCDPVLTDADKAAMLEGIKRNSDAVLALKKAGQPYAADNHPNFNWSTAFPLLKSHIARADNEEAASASASSRSVSSVAGKKRAGAAQDRPSAKKPAADKPSAKRSAR